MSLYENTVDCRLKARACRKDERIGKGNNFRNGSRHVTVLLLLLK
jgi:hypothetical protein